MKIASVDKIQECILQKFWGKNKTEKEYKLSAAKFSEWNKILKLKKEYVTLYKCNI